MAAAARGTLFGAVMASDEFAPPDKDFEERLEDVMLKYRRARIVEPRYSDRFGAP